MHEYSTGGYDKPMPLWLKILLLPLKIWRLITDWYFDDVVGHS